MRISTHGPRMHSAPQSPSASARPKVDEQSSPIQATLFGSVRPRPLDLAQFPQLAEQMRWLSKQKVKIAALFGEPEGDFVLQLAEGMTACIDARGIIYIGEKLLAEEQALLAGVLAHEIGHRPKTWKRLRQGHGLSRAQLQQLAREEEAKADHAAGRALAALELSVEPICAFLERHGHYERQPESYFPVETRVAIIREAYDAQRARKAAARSLFPAFARATEVKHLMQEDRPRGVGKKKRRVVRSV